MEADSIVEQISELHIRSTGNAEEKSQPVGSTSAPNGHGPPAESVVAGMESAVQSLRELIGWPLLFKEQGRELGVRWMKGVLLHGPPGCGKTLLVNAVAAEYGVKVHPILASDTFGAFTGESEQRLRDAFEAAENAVLAGRPTVIFLDEIDALCPRRSAGQAHESRVVAQLLTLLDGAAQTEETMGKLFVVAATNRPNALDPALRRAGRLDREIAIPVPDVKARLEILRLQTAAMPVGERLDLEAIARAMVGFSGADIASLCREAAMLAVADEAAATTLVPAPPQREDTCGSAAPDSERISFAPTAEGASRERSISKAHFQAAMAKVTPSISRGAEVDFPPVKWDDIGGLDDVKRRLKQAVEWPLKHAAAFHRLGLSPPRGVLLHGPPGCSKTTLARAAATASGASLQALSSTQLYSAYLGEGEASLRAAFQRARSAAPAILFLDELDALAGNRGPIGMSAPGHGQGSASEGARLLSALLTEMDGIEHAEGVLVLGATNRPEAIDNALLRPGRFDVHLFVPPPDASGRLEILRIHTRSIPLSADVDLQDIARRTERYTGAELEGICSEAALAALREDLLAANRVTAHHFDAVLNASKPSLSTETLEKYANWRN